jgi:hypothetical protein
LFRKGSRSQESERHGTRRCRHLADAADAEDASLALPDEE